ncbi:hypothetical protein [Pseudomonas zhanjiangensis]|uniref:HEPN domain-containing protein n=1 Tax=Pseudomonas zhanjiangensis TaxID=3239015 RepID=A0ABV3YXY6_9PSED
MGTIFLPDNRVVREARIYRTAALLLEKQSLDGNSDLFWPAAMNAALAIEIYLKAFLVEEDTPSIKLNAAGRKAKHDLAKLFRALPENVRTVIDEVNAEIAPTLSLEQTLGAYSDYFTNVRYGYEQDARKVIRGELFTLMDRMEQICVALAPVIVPAKSLLRKGSTEDRVSSGVSQAD